MTGSLFDAARGCLDAATPADKLARTRVTASAFSAGALGMPGDALPPEPIRMPGRPPQPRLVHPRALPRRGLGGQVGRAAFVHAIAHIEFNAIDLAWDAVYRFRGMPDAYYADWAGVAADEARHFALLRERLQEMGHDYGDFDAHNGLWEMAEKTAGDGMARMALVPRVLEARGLDVTPGIDAAKGTASGQSVSSRMPPASTRSTDPCSYQSPSTIRRQARPATSDACIAGRWVWPWIMVERP
jgi:uncharacterized ferritin-like protein (DUF455 family)